MDAHTPDSPDEPSDSAVMRDRAVSAALAAAIQRPPLRVKLRHEPRDRVDGYPTMELTPCGAATALATLDRVALPPRGGRVTKVLVEGRRLLEAGESRLSHARREVLRSKVIGASLLIDTTDAIELARACDERLTIATIDGPVDESDAKALEEAVASGQTPLDADLRASGMIQVGGFDRRWSPLWGQFREIAIARRFASRLLTLYVARSLGRPVTWLPSIDLDGLRLPTSIFTVRPGDIRMDGVTIVVPVRSAARGAIVNLTLDCTTERWYA